MTSVESRAVIGEEEEEEEGAGAEVPSGTPSPSTTSPTSLFFILKPRQASQGGRDLFTNLDCSLAAPGSPATAVQDLPPITPKGSSAEGTCLPGELSATSTCKGVTVTLRNIHMWNEFHGYRTEMILTKQGRRMFPYCCFSIAGLEPLKRYILAMDITPMDNSRWKWNGLQWESSGKAEPHALGRVFIHPDSPSLGHCWTQSSVSFYKMKLTNNTQDKEGHIVLHSMHRYLPRLHLVPTENTTSVIQLNGPDVMTFTFPQTEFIAVTTYQNLCITQLKISCNPFAKGFREEGPFSMLTKPKAESSEPLLCSSLVLNHSKRRKTKLSNMKTLKSLLRPTKNLDEAVEQDQQQTGGFGAGSFHGVPSALQMDSAIRGEKRPNPSVCTEQKLKVRRVDPERRNGVYTGTERELRKRSYIAGEGMLVVQGEGGTMAVGPSTVRPSAPEAHASTTSEHEDSGRVPICSLNPPRKTTKPPATSSKSFIRQSPADPVLTPVSKPSLAGSDKGLNLYGQATAGKEETHEASTPAHSATLLTSTSTSKRKPKSKRRYSGKYKKYMEKSGVTVQKVAVQPMEAAMLADLEDVEGMLFVSFVSKEALGVHLRDLPLSSEEHVPPKEKTYPPKRIEVVETLEEKIVRLQDVLLQDLGRLKHRQVIHTVLQEVGLKLSLLDPTLAIDLQYLGVRLPLPLHLFSPEDNKGSAGLTPSPEGAPFHSRTGKTNDFTKIKGWREKFVTSEMPSLKLADDKTATGADPGLRDLSAFCSDMLDEYLAREGPLMDTPTAGGSSPSPSPLVLYQLPTKSSSYIRPLHTVLNRQAPNPAPPTLPLKPFPACSKHKAKPKPKHTFRPASMKASAFSSVKRLLSAPYTAKSLAAANKVLAPPLSSPATKPRPHKPDEKPDYSAARRSLAKVMLKLMDMEDRAVWEGNNQTTITNERAELAMAALLTAQGTSKISRVRSKHLPRWAAPCRQAFCRLGCVCASLAKGQRVTTHCRKPTCMFGCSCLKHKMVLVRPSLISSHKPEPDDHVGQELPGEALSSNSEPEEGGLIGQKLPEEAVPSHSKPDQGGLIGQETPGEEFPSNSKPEQDAIMKQEMTGSILTSTCQPGLGDLAVLDTIGEDATTYHRKKKKKKRKNKKRHKERLSYAILEAVREVEVEPAARLHRLWNGKEGEVDPEPLYIPSPVCLETAWPYANDSAHKSTTLRTYVPRPNPVVRDEDKGPVYLYFESMMTCARVREYTSKPPPEQPLCFCKSTLCSGKEDDQFHCSTHITEGKKQSKAKPPLPQQTLGEPRRALEVLSECDWGSEQDRILATVCRRAAQGHLSQPFHIGPFLVRPFGPALRKEGDACSIAHKVLITRPPKLLPERVVAKSLPIERPKAPKLNRATKGLPFWSDILPAGLLTAKMKQPGLAAKGLIKVNGKSYSQAKVQLGQMGALHMTSRLAAYLTGRWQPQNQKMSIKSPPTLKSVSSESSTPQSTEPTTPECTPSTSGPVHTPLESPVAPMLLVPVQNPDSGSAALSSAGPVVPLAPGERVVLHPVRGPSGTPLFRHPSGRLLQLVPLKQLRPDRPKLLARSPGAVSPVLQPLAPAYESASADAGAASPAPTMPLPPPCPTGVHTGMRTAGPAAAKPAPCFLGQRGTHTIRIGPVVASRTRSKGPAASGFAPLQVSQIIPPQMLRDEADAPRKGLSSPKSRVAWQPGTDPQPPAEVDSGGPGPSHMHDSAGERRSHTATPRLAETQQSRSSMPVRRLAVTLPRASAQTAGGAQSGSRVLLADVSEDSEEESVGEINDGEWEELHEDEDVDVETVEELPEEKSTTQTTAGASPKKLTKVGPIRQAGSQAELDTHLQARQSEVYTERQNHTESERRRRSHMADLLTRLHDVLGIRSVSKISTIYVLNRAIEEIKALEDQCSLLEEQKRRLTQNRADFINEITQGSGTVTAVLRPPAPAYESASADVKAVETATSPHTSKGPSLKRTTSSEAVGGAQSGSGVAKKRGLSAYLSEDSEEDSAVQMSNKEWEELHEDVDVETVKELPEEKSTTQATAGASPKKLTKVGLIHQTDLYTNVQARQLQINAESERQRRSHMADLLTRLQDVLGVQSVSKISRAYVLGRAVEEIKALEDHCSLLEERKRRMTQKRAVFIKKIAQRSGKAEELIILKLQDICAKQKSLEAKKQKAQQRAPGPDRKHSPPTPATECGNFMLPKIVSVRSLARSPLITTTAREQDELVVSEATQPAVFPEGSQNGNLLGDYPPIPSSLQKEGVCS